MSQFGDGYVGSAEDSSRIRRMDKKRTEERKKFQEAQKMRQDRIDSAGLRKFDAATTEAIEHAFKNETVGLVTKKEFMQKRATLQDRLEEEMRLKLQAEEEASAKEKEKRKRDKAAASRLKLSFAAGEDEEEEEQEEEDRPRLNVAFKTTSLPSGGADGEAAGGGDGGGEGGTTTLNPTLAVKRPKLVGKFGKDPSVPTDFLPDKEREEREEALRAELKKEYLRQQDAVKAEEIEVTYSYWDGAGHRRTIKVKKGNSIGDFLKAVRDQLGTQFKEMRGVSVDNLMYIKEDIILPQHYTFYDLIKTQARGKSGPLFEFGVVEDIRVVNDASKEKGDSHAGKVVERHWYDRNKHIFPANRWENFDPEKKWDGYTVHDYVEKH